LVHVVERDSALVADLGFAFATAGMRCHMHTTSEHLLRHLETEPAHAVLVEVQLPVGDRVEALEAICSHDPALSVVVLLERAAVELAVRAMRAGAYTVVERGTPCEEIAQALGDACQRTADLRSRQAQHAYVRARLDSLSPRERQVMELVVEGAPTKAIAQRLAISPKTVDVHRMNLMRKLRVDSVAALVRMVLSAQ